MKIDERIRQGVIESLPEAKQIQNKELREKVYDAWAMSLGENGYTRIEEMPPSPVPDATVAKSGTQADHLRSVARLSVAIAKELQDTFKEFDVDMDEVIAGGLCHDLGKPFEYNQRNRERWTSDPRITGKPSIRHTVYGVHVALSVGLPEKIAHIAGAHSMEGQYVERSLVAELVHYADEAFWRILDKAGILEN
ncbi:HDIG domain-containing protein [bacterium]|nr:HDIG domain-containing protein [bacterium]